MADISYRDEDGAEAAERVAGLLQESRRGDKVLEADDFESERFGLRLMAGETPRAGRTMSWTYVPARSSKADGATDPKDFCKVGWLPRICLAVVFGAPLVGFFWMCRKFGWL